MRLELFLASHTRINLRRLCHLPTSSVLGGAAGSSGFAVDEYVMDQQYQEFISLLKYFVRMQEVKLPIVHVLHKGGSEFALYDEQFRVLEGCTD